MFFKYLNTLFQLYFNFQKPFLVVLILVFVNNNLTDAHLPR